VLFAGELGGQEAQGLHNRMQFMDGIEEAGSEGVTRAVGSLHGVRRHRHGRPAQDAPTTLEGECPEREVDREDPHRPPDRLGNSVGRHPVTIAFRPRH